MIKLPTVNAPVMNNWSGWSVGGLLTFFSVHFGSCWPWFTWQQQFFKNAPEVDLHRYGPKPIKWPGWSRLNTFWLRCWEPCWQVPKTWLVRDRKAILCLLLLMSFLGSTGKVGWDLWWSDKVWPLQISQAPWTCWSMAAPLPPLNGRMASHEGSPSPFCRLQHLENTFPTQDGLQTC